MSDESMDYAEENTISAGQEYTRNSHSNEVRVETRTSAASYSSATLEHDGNTAPRVLAIESLATTSVSSSNGGDSGVTSIVATTQVCSIADTTGTSTAPNGSTAIDNSNNGLNIASSPTNGGGGVGFGLSLMQSSPPPHSYRHSRAYRHFKNPPQPHMCIRTTTEVGEELFINVLSWTRIVIPQEPSDPIPLYGGMRVPPGSPRSPPIVFAVMANPEVLKDSGRHSKDPEERRAMVELMCDFVEAMNPGVKLIRNAIILKDRDISGELKDVWNAVQAQRDREREEQIMQQRQQQHYHNITTQQMFPKSASAEANGLRQGQLPSRPEEEATADGMSTEKDATGTGATHLPTQYAQTDNKSTAKAREEGGSGSSFQRSNSDVPCGESAAMNGDAENGCNKLDNASVDQIDATAKTLNSDVGHGMGNCKTPDIAQPQQQQASAKNKNTNAPVTPVAAALPTNVSTTLTAAANNTSAAAVTVVATPPTKKDKLGGFLPNGCIFPRFKNNKHKDKEKEKEGKTKKETLLNALKKSKDKKVAPIEQQCSGEKTSPEAEAAAKTQYEKNCINLESEVQKLDLNKMDPTANTDNMFIKLKVAANSAAAK